MARRMMTGLAGTVERYRYALAAFLVPLTIRAIPEIIAGPYPIGYDTVAAYIPAMLDWGSGNPTGFTPLIGGWLVYAILGITYLTTRIDPVLIAKILAPLVYGSLGFSFYFFSRRSLGWIESKSLFLVVLSSTYFVLLRISWDLVRNTLGLSLLLLTLTLSQNIATRRKALVFAVFAWLVTTAHLLVATILVSLLLIEAVKSRNNRMRKILCSAPAFAQFSISLIAIGLQGVGYLAEGSPSFELLAAYLFPVYIFLPLLPHAVLGLRKLSFGPVKQWLLICCLGLVFATTPISISSHIVGADRWALMMAVPLSICAAQVSETKSLLVRVRFPRTRWSSWFLVLLVLGGAYLVLPAQLAFPYYRYFSPTSMMQSTIPLEDSHALVSAIAWLSANIQSGAVIMTHHAMYGWVREYFRGTNSIVSFPPSVDLGLALQQTILQGYSRIYTIWWRAGFGWYGITVPQDFVPVHSEGQISVYYASIHT